jgi:subtilase family serine protease
VLDTENFISEIAAISGISTNFSSGDDGDFSAFGLSPTVSAPADSPYATAVGGITLALNSDNSIAWQAGWGNNQSLLTEDGTIYDPPLESGFTGGAGGGPSAVFSKPSFQKGVPGTWRQVPDVSWLADPYTGVAILISVPGSVPQQVWQVWGGTSVACPMFSGLWAIANQEAGVALGQAAPYLYTLPAGAVTDIVPVGSPNNVTASIRETTGTNHYTPAEVLGGQTPATPPKFVSAIWDYPQISETTVVVSFGTDCSMLPSSDFDGTSCGTPGALQTKVGWDNVTGVGVPNGQAFADAFAPAAKTK